MSITETLVGESIAQAMLAEFETQAPITRRFLERLPEDKLTWKPHEKSMTAGQLAFHIASTPGGLVRFVQTNPAQAPNFAFPQPVSCHEILRAHDESVAVVREILPTIDDAAMAETWRLIGRRQGGAGASAWIVFARRDVQPHLPASRPVQRLPAHPEYSRAGELGTERRRAAAVHAEKLIRIVEEKPMCPFCLASAAVVAASASGAGGVAALLYRQIAAESDSKNFHENDRHGGGSTWPR